MSTYEVVVDAVFFRICEAVIYLSQRNKLPYKIVNSQYIKLSYIRRGLIIIMINIIYSR